MDRSRQTDMPLAPPAPAKAGRDDMASVLRPKKTMQIAVSGGVLVTDLEREILDTPDFQRLRGIRQLGLAHLVYPSALHTRFDHSLGTLHMASRMAQAIRENAHNDERARFITDAQLVTIRLYALLHDITHIPFGHSVEDELELLVRHDQNEERVNRFLGPESEIASIITRTLGPEVLAKLLQIYRWDGNPDNRTFPASEVFIHDLVSNTVCADLLDYLLRDNLFCNLGVSLEYHFIKFLYLGEDDHGQRRVFVRLWKDDARGGRPRRDTLTDLCRLLETRYIMAERVYYHHAKIAASVMLGRAIQEALEDGELDESVMSSMTDDVLLARLRASKNELTRRLATEVSHRRLYKQQNEFGWEAVQKGQAEYHLTNQYQDVIHERVGSAENRRDFENMLADIIRAEPGDVLIYAPTRKMNRKEAQMNVLWEGRPTQLKDIDDPVVRPRLNATLEAHKLLWSIRLHVRPSLTARQRQLAQDLCEVELLSHTKERDAKRRALYAQVVESALDAENRRIPSAAREYQQQVAAIVDELLVPGHKGEAFSKRLRRAIDRVFPDSVG